jgi:hypothetical protein
MYTISLYQAAVPAYDIFFRNPSVPGAEIGQLYSTGLRAVWSVVRVPAEAGKFLFTIAFIPALGPTQPPIQLVPRVLSLGVKLPEREANHPPTSSADVKKWVELYLYSPVRLHAMVLS